MFAQGHAAALGNTLQPVHVGSTAIKELFFSVDDIRCAIRLHSKDGPVRFRGAKLRPIQFDMPHHRGELGKIGVYLHFNRRPVQGPEAYSKAMMKLWAAEKSGSHLFERRELLRMERQN